MKNIKLIMLKSIKACMYFCAAIVCLILLLLVVYHIVLWIALDFDPYFFYIDSCLDLGGSWNEEINDCEGSESYKEWKERTWY